MPERSWAFVDGILGPQQFDPPAGGDFVVRRADGVIAYQLAVVVDDAAMRITQVVRGADLLDSTPRQLALYEALDLTPPQFAHVPLLCGPDGRRLAKRHGDLSLKALRQAGRGPELLIGWLAWLGGFIDRMEPLTARDLLAEFRLDRVPRECIVIDEGRLAALKTGYGLA
jgi:glutamyl-tRNA synthetase